MIRNTKLLNSTNILRILNDLGNFEDELNSKEVDVIADGIVKKLNFVSNALAPSKRVQLKKDFKVSDDPEIKELFEDAKRAKAKDKNRERAAAVAEMMVKIQRSCAVMKWQWLKQKAASRRENS